MRCNALFVVFGWFVSVQVAIAQPVIVFPNEFATTEANIGTSVPLRETGQARTYQMQISVSEFTGMPVGAQITGLRWRMDAGQAANFPPTAATFDSYDFTLAQAANPIPEMSEVFADNMLNPVLVREGPLTFAAGSFPRLGSPTSFGPLITFTTPYIYQGGDLVVFFTHTGSNIATTAALDAADNETPGYGERFRAQFALGYQAEESFFSLQNFHVLVTQLQFSVAVPELSTWALLGLTALSGGAIVRWRRRSTPGTSREVVTSDGSALSPS